MGIALLFSLGVVPGRAAPSEVALERQRLLAQIGISLTDLRQFVFMTDGFSFDPERPALRQLGDLIRLAEAEQVSLDGEAIYGRYLLFDQTVLRVFHARDAELDPVLAALRARYVELAAKEVGRWSAEDLRGDAGRKSLDFIAKLLHGERDDGEVDEVLEKLRLALQKKYRAVFDRRLAALTLDEVEREIAKHKSLQAREYTLGRRTELERLARRYFETLGAWMRIPGPGGELVLKADDSHLKDPRDRLVADLREWHPLFALEALQLILDEGPVGMHELALGLAPAVSRETVRRIRANQYATQPIGEEEKTRGARGMLETFMISESEKLWEHLSVTLLDRTAPILVESTAFGIDVLKLPVHVEVDVLDRVCRVIGRVEAEHDHGGMRRRLREPETSAAVSGALGAAADSILVEAGIESSLKVTKLQQLTQALVLLQTGESKDALLALFESTENYRPTLTEATYPRVEAVLVRQIAAFVARGRASRDARRHAFAIVDRLLTLLREEVRLASERGEAPQLTNRKVVDALMSVRATGPDTMEEYVRWTYGGEESALAPVRLEAVVYHLADLCVDYAALGRFQKPEVGGEGGKPPVTPGPRPPQELVMDLLHWTNEALANVPEVPETSFEELEGAQRGTLSKIYRGLAFDLRRRDPRFVETLLQVAERLVRSADRTDVRRFVYAPFARILKRDQAIETAPFITNAMLLSLETMWKSLGEEGRPFDRPADSWP